MSGEPGAAEVTRAREHLANQRTLLAWIRTAISLMGLGFVVARFGIFLRQVSFDRTGTDLPGAGLAAPIGIAFVAAGMIAAGLSCIRYFRARSQIEAGRLIPEVFAEVAAVAITIVGGTALIIYLAVSH